MSRENKRWTKGRDRIDNVRTKKLYEILEKMTFKNDRVQRTCIDPKVNHYLCRSANNVLGTNSKPSLQEEAEILRSIIFPDKKAIKSAHLRNVDSEIIRKVRFDEVAENILTDKQLHKNIPSSKYTAKKRSIHTDTYKHDIANDARSVYTIASNICNKKQDTVVREIAKPTFTNDNKMKARIKSSIEEYLQHYSDNIRKSCIEEEERSRDVKPSASDIADILESYNMGSNVLYENFEKYSDSYDSDDYMNENNEDHSNVTQVTSVNTVENRKVRDNISLENIGLCDDTRLTKAIDTRLFNHDNRRQSNCQDNAFINMGLNKDLSKETLLQILQSEYLKKDLSL